MFRLLLVRCFPPFLAVFLLNSLQRCDIIIILSIFTTWTLTEAIVENEITNRDAKQSTLDENSRTYILGAHILAWYAPLINCWLIPGATSSLWFSVGVTLTLLGALLRIISVYTLGSYFTGHIQVQSDQEICEKGVYGLVRHPSYIALFFLNIGFSVATRAWLAFVVVTITTLIANHIRVSVEEKVMNKYFEKNYKIYCLRVPRWVPSFRSRFQAI